MKTDNSYILPAPEATSKVLSTSIPARHVPPHGSGRQSGKRKVGAKSGNEAFRAPTSLLSDVEALRAENKYLRARLAFSEDTRAHATYNVMKARTIQKACVDAQKTAESQLKSCQNMIYAKDKELTEALNELAKAQGLLAKLRVHGYAEPQGPTRT
ncbi:hypothetical protein Fot_24080 [Forsythia ovata]|uniref:Uncharacterized protein n=1 Tax=Forsythia ovata TaxID=205694 RepID=A0ABD1U5A2_9LAMI